MKINLIFFISQFDHGGAGNSIFRLCKNLSKKIYNINIICLNNCAYQVELKKKNIKIFNVKATRTAFAMLEIRHIVKKIISTKYKKNIFISNINYSNILSVLFLKKLKMKLILVERTPFQELNIFFNLIDLFKKIIMKLLIRLTYKHADLCISNSTYISSQYNKKYHLKFRTINPPSYNNEINFINKSKKKNNVFTLGTVCRLTQEKGLFRFLNIISKLKFDFKFLIIGNGPHKKLLKNLVIKLNMENKVIFCGFLEYKKIKQRLKKIDLFINCSYFEGFPNSVVESLANGIPVLASQSHGGINEIIKNKNFGYIYKNKKELIKFLNDFYLKKKKIYINKKETYNHLKKFSISRNVNKYSSVFNNI